VDDALRGEGGGTEDARCESGTVRGGFREVTIGFRNNREIAMLVLSRKLGEKIVIGENIVVTVVKIDRNQIRIGIEAPHDVPVYREEIAPQRAVVRSGATEAVALSR
jgi:carbon storage regulator